MEPTSPKLLVSIITVCFNSESTITDTLESVLNQTYPNFEYIIIDGGSTDNTINIIQEYKIKFLKKDINFKWTSERDEGLYHAMNKGINKCKGELIGFLNSDDWYEVNALYNVVKAYTDKVGLIHGNLFLCDLDKKMIKPLKPLTKQKSYLKGTPFLHPASFFKLEEIKKLDHYYNLNFKIAADYDFMIRLIKNNIKIVYLNKNIGYFREGGISTTQMVNSFYESHEVRVLNGVNTIISYSIFIYVTSRHYTGRLLHKLQKKLKRLLFL